jgi:hypothetical protein
VARVPQSGPVLLTGPPGAGKTTLLLRAARALSERGWVPVYVDLMGAASSPERFTLAALDALSAESFGSLLARATQIRRLAEPGADGAAAVQALLSLWASLGDAGGRPVALLLDEATEIRSLAYFGGLRQVDRPFAAALGARRRGTILASSYPTLARKLWPSMETVELGPLAPEDLAASAPLALPAPARRRISVARARWVPKRSAGRAWSAATAKRSGEEAAPMRSR